MNIKRKSNIYVCYKRNRERIKKIKKRILIFFKSTIRNLI